MGESPSGRDTRRILEVFFFFFFGQQVLEVAALGFCVL